MLTLICFNFDLIQNVPTALWSILLHYLTYRYNKIHVPVFTIMAILLSSWQMTKNILLSNLSYNQTWNFELVKLKNQGLVLWQSTITYCQHMEKHYPYIVTYHKQTTHDIRSNLCMGRVSIFACRFEVMFMTHLQ